jgi:dolichol-phosphate mannosyltransferase
VNPAFDVSIVIPALREQASLQRLLPRLFDALQQADLAAEVIIVDDDSRDGTDELCCRMAQRHALRLITRTNERGLATAVMRGLQEATGDICVVMDADLSHPPEAVPKLVEAVRSPFCDVAIGSRYTRGGSVDSDWSWLRRLNSRAATLLARGLTNAADPLAGFFAIRRSTLARATTLRPLGYKILLEIIVRCDCRRIVEIPIHFLDRKQGTSKLSFTQQWLYLQHLAKLYAARYLSARPGQIPAYDAESKSRERRRKSA